MTNPYTAVQDFYPDDVAHCFGCGRLNPEGHKLRTVWDGDETLTRFTPASHHTAVPGYVYGGLIASLIHCHGTGTAAAAMIRQAGREVGDGPAPRFVTASLHVDFLRPTPLGPELEVRGRATEMGRRKIVVSAELSAAGQVCARGEVVAVMMSESLM